MTSTKWLSNNFINSQFFFESKSIQKHTLIVLFHNYMYCMNIHRLHLHNAEQMSKAAREEGFVGKGGNRDYVDKFGFHAVTCCGYLPQDNTWESSWTVSFNCLHIKNVFYFKHNKIVCLT